MSFNQEKAGEGRYTLPAYEMSPLSGLPEGSVGNTAALGSDNLPAQHGAHCGQHPASGAVPITAPAAPRSERWASIPQGLRERPQWCVARPDKAPLIATQGLPLAKTTDPSTWRTFNEACALAAHQGLHIGYMLHSTDPFTCIDLDVKDDTPLEQLQGYGRIVRAFDSYTELSRSGKGCHIWVEGPSGKGARYQGVEVYSQERFIICTGNAWEIKPVANRQELLGILLKEMRDRQATTTVPLTEVDETDSDAEIGRRASEAENGEKFKQLWAGSWKELGYPSQSEADLSLLAMLAFYTKSNEQVRRLFRMSVLGTRVKARKNNRYIDRTLAMIRGRQHREEVAVNVEALIANMVRNLLPPGALNGEVQP